MSRRSRQKRKSNKQQPKSLTNKPRLSSKSDGSKGKRTGTALTIVSLLIGAVALIALRPQVSVSTTQALQGKEPFSVPFVIKNLSYYALRNVRPLCYIQDVDVRTSAGGRFTSHGTIAYRKWWDTARLERGEPDTIDCFFVGGGNIPAKADLMIVVDYDIPFVPWYRGRQYFRFVGVYGDNWQWHGQPSGPIQQEADRAIAKEGL